MANVIGADGIIDEQNGFRVEAAEQFGFESIDGEDAPGQPGYFCTEDELIAFAKACERKGMADALVIAKSSGAFGAATRLKKRIAEIDVELAPVLESERVRFLTARGEG
jgi:hypothetical protein